MTEKRFGLVKCYNEQWGIVDKSLEEIDQLVLIATSKSGTLYLVNELNELHKENQELRLLVDTLKEQNMKFKLRLEDLGVEYL